MKKRAVRLKVAKGQTAKSGSAVGKQEQNGKNGEHNSEHNRDISSKDVFDNPVLCAQFLRDNLNIPLLKNVQPEDIEDISSRYHPYLGTEFESDSVQKIRILDIGKENAPPFLVSLIDHKSLVDYDAAMQLLRYMMCIWTAYKKEMEAKHEGITRRKDFRYPVIIPIIYFEGRAKWTAAREFRERIGREAEFRKWIPNFRYELVNVCGYSNEELLNRGDEMSLIMLINKVQKTADLEQFLHISGDKLNQIIADSPEHVVDVIVSAMESLCFKIGVSDKERVECVRKVREREMGYLWENMEKISIQEERRKTEEQRRKTEKERRKTEKERKRAEEAHKKAEEAHKKVEEAHKKVEEEREKAEEEHKRAEEEREKAEEEHKKAEEEREKAEEEHKKAEEEREKAEEERRKAEEQQKLAEKERRRADAAEEKLRAAEEMIRQLNDKYQKDK